MFSFMVYVQLFRLKITGGFTERQYPYSEWRGISQFKSNTECSAVLFNRNDTRCFGALTGCAEPENSFKILQTGFLGILRKPVLFRLLIHEDSLSMLYFSVPVTYLSERPPQNISCGSYPVIRSKNDRLSIVWEHQAGKKNLG